MKQVARRPIRILGVDPGSRVVGFALLESIKSVAIGPRDWRVVDAGVLRAPTELSMPERIGALHEAMFDLVCELKPTHAAVEKTFHGVNSSSTIKMGEARGALVSAISRCRVPVTELTPAEIKRLVGGSGAATKEHVSQSLQSLLGFQRGSLPLDASDAVAIALTASMQIMSVTPKSSVVRTLDLEPDSY